jgi:hypothetical protein
VLGSSPHAPFEQLEARHAVWDVIGPRRLGMPRQAGPARAANRRNVAAASTMIRTMPLVAAVLAIALV